MYVQYEKGKKNMSMVHNRLSSLLRRAQAGIVPRVHECVGGEWGGNQCARSPCSDRRSSCVFIVRVVDLANCIEVIIFVVRCVWLVSLRRLCAWCVSLWRFSSLCECAALLQELGECVDALFGAKDGGEVDVLARTS